MTVEFHEQASAELDEAIDWYERRRRGLGRDLAEEVRAAVTRIGDTPSAWAVVAPPELRRCPVHRFPYGLLYQIQRDRVLVIAVAHAKRRPGYWRPRVRG